jgi:formylglycine-generating enzyme required for sulfatase activity
MNMKVMYRKDKYRRVKRGGAWLYSASNLRAAYRYDSGPSYQSTAIGARLSKYLGGKNEPKGGL